MQRPGKGLPVPDLFICDGNFFQLINRGWKARDKKRKKDKKILGLERVD